MCVYIIIHQNVQFIQKGGGRSRKGFEHKKFFNSTHVNYRSIPELTFCYKWTCCACTLF